MRKFGRFFSGLPHRVRAFYGDLRCFLNMAQADKMLDPKTFDEPFTGNEAVNFLRSVIGLTQ